MDKKMKIGNTSIISYIIGFILFASYIPNSYAEERNHYITKIEIVAHLKTGEEVKTVVYTQYTRDNKYSESDLKTTFREITVDFLKQCALKQILFSKPKIEYQLFRSLESKYPDNINLKGITIESFNLSKKLQNDLDKISLLIQEIKRADYHRIRDNEELKFLKLNLKANEKKNSKKVNENISVRIKQLTKIIDSYPLKTKALKEEKQKKKKRIGLLDVF